MSEKNELKNGSITLILWAIIALLLVVGGIFAWFTFKTTTNITPDTAGTISDGGVGLLISNTIDGQYGENCDLIFQSTGEDLSPVSTADMDTFYTASAQNGNGITILFSDATGQIDNCSTHGYVYLKADGGTADVYLNQAGLSFGEDSQALAAMRLGLKVTDGDGTRVIICKLDDMGDTSSAESLTTIESEGCVVSAIENGSPVFVTDPAQNISEYSASGDQTLIPGNNKLARVSGENIATVEYWLYLEGCDAQCINAVQKKDVSFALSFAGTLAR